MNIISPDIFRSGLNTVLGTDDMLPWKNNDALDIINRTKGILFNGMPINHKLAENKTYQYDFLGADNPAAYKEFKQECIARNVPDHYNNKKITYTIDTSGFRVYPDISDVTMKQSIFFFGCSNMFGTGLADDETLPHMMYTRLKGKYNVRNFGIASSSNDEHSRLIFQTLKYSKQKPRAIFWRMTHKNRREYFSVHKKTIQSVQLFAHARDTYGINELTKEYIIDPYLKMICEENDFVNVVRNYKFAETVCNALNIPLFWIYGRGNKHMIEGASKKRIKLDPARLYAMFRENELFDVTKTITDSIPKSILQHLPARDNQHAGHHSQLWLADQLLNVFEQNGI